MYDLILIVAAVVPAVFLMVKVYQADRLEKEPIGMLIGLFFLGIISTTLAGITEELGSGALANLFDFGKTEHGNTEYYYHFDLNGHEVLVIDYYHPANHFPEIMNYFTLTSIYGLAKADQYRRFCDDIQKQRGKEQQ